MREILDHLISEVESGRSVALITVVKRAGSTPRGPGARMLVRSDGSIAGTVGGGALEAFSYRSALAALASRASMLVPFNLNPNDANALGMICGGDGQLLIEYIDACDLGWIDCYKTVAQEVRRGEIGWMVSVLPSEAMVQFAAGLCVTRTDGAIVAKAGSQLHDSDGVTKAAARVHVFSAIEELAVIIDPIGNGGTAFIFGAGHVGRSLVPVLAAVGFRTVVLDDRAEFLTREQFQNADELIQLESFTNPFAALSVNKASYVIIVTRGHVLDKSVLKQSLATDAGYIGVIGSRRKLQLTFDALLAEGLTQEQLKRVHAPIGMDIGAETPAEIAISIAAELIKVRAEKMSRLSAHSSPVYSNPSPSR